MSWDRRPRHFDPAPPRGLVESQATMCFARYGYWPDQFRDFISRFYGGRVPPRFTNIVERLRRDRPWEQPDPPSNGGRYSITIVGRNRITCIVQEETEHDRTSPKTTA